jgi:hypothetical protein
MEAKNKLISEKEAQKREHRSFLPVIGQNPITKQQYCADGITGRAFKVE